VTQTRTTTTTTMSNTVIAVAADVNTPAMISAFGTETQVRVPQNGIVVLLIDKATGQLRMMTNNESPHMQVYTPTNITNLPGYLGAFPGYIAVLFGEGQWFNATAPANNEIIREIFRYMRYPYTRFTNSTSQPIVCIYDIENQDAVCSTSANSNDFITMDFVVTTLANRRIVECVQRYERRSRNSVYLSDLPYSMISLFQTHRLTPNRFYEHVLNLNGQSYQKGFALHPDTVGPKGSVEIDINSVTVNGGTLSGIVGVQDAGTANSRGTLRIYLDEILAYVSPEVTYSNNRSLSSRFNVVVPRDTVKIRFESEVHGSHCGAHFVVVDPLFTY
jgi:hypothetical protein